MVGILVIVAVIGGVILLCAFRNSFIEKYNRSCMHIPHVIIMVLYLLSIAFTSSMSSFFGILCWIALAGMFVYYVTKYGILAAIGVWLYNSLLFVLGVVTIGQLIGATSPNKKK